MTPLLLLWPNESESVTVSLKGKDFRKANTSNVEIGQSRCTKK